MLSLQQLLRASHAILFLVFCLHLGFNHAQTAIPKVIEMNVTMPTIVQAGENVDVMLSVKSQLNECMVISTYLRTPTPQEGSFNYKYTACLCNDYPRKFFWDFQTNDTLAISIMVDVTREKGICPNDRAVMPITANRFILNRGLIVY
ncbi:PREDICTED: prolactin-inducible protein [Condylura cristata]|uniref:prolactin-inducible protein n=1 Tax=Condylura cristata TaxID=143302 RepID=UPI0006438708|nr:PREDICTED: prolactin-inducible protein [Condylura cristata]